MLVTLRHLPETNKFKELSVQTIKSELLTSFKLLLRAKDTGDTHRSVITNVRVKQHEVSFYMHQKYISTRSTVMQDKISCKNILVTLSLIFIIIPDASSNLKRS